MLATWPTRTHAAARMSDTVPRQIARGADAPSAIHSVYRSVINVSMADGLLAIASPSIGGLPNGILVELGPDLRALGLRPGMTVVATDRQVGIPSIGLEVDLAAAARWSPRLGSADGGADRAGGRWRRRSAAAWAIAGRRAAAAGLGALLRGDPWTRDDLGIVSLAHGRLDRLRAALLAGDRRAAACAARGLIGLGPGLTPSGDDALVGIEAALRALEGPTAGFLGEAIHDVGDRTTAIAATLLRHAADGEFAERIHALMLVLLGEDDGALPVALDRAVAWGATSGTDCLLGVLLGLDVASGTRPRPT